MSPTDGVIREAWELYKAHWRHLIPISFAVYLAVAVISALLVLALTWLGVLIGLVVSLIGLFWMEGALATAVDDVRDGRADLSFEQTFSRVRPQLGAITMAGVLAGLGIGIGLVLLVVPGLVLLTFWILIIPVIALERTTASAAFGRSRELVRGYGWNVFGVIVLTILLLIGFEIVLSIALTPVADWLRSFVSKVVSGTLTAPFIAAVWTLLYFRLRDAKSAAASTAPAVSE
jgi:hypothetical protein